MRVFLVFAALLAASSSYAGGVQIQYSETLRDVQLAFAPGSPGDGAVAGAQRSLRFDAFGKRFDMRLLPNHAVLSEAQRKQLPGNIEIYRGDIAGAPGSWLRIVIADGTPRGMFWDGAELYAIEVSDSGKPFIYRLEDALIPAGTLSCGHIGSAKTAKSLYQAVVREATAAAASGPGATQQIDLAVVGDFEFTSDKGAGTDAALVARINIVDGIFSSQLGVQINVNRIDSFSDINDPFTDETDAALLIDEVSDFRFGSSEQRANGLTHLFTGRNLDGTTVGIAFGGAICSSRFGAGLTQGTHSEAFDSLIAAHEIGHNFGAPHDGVAGSPCESEPQTFLMAPLVNGSNQFSGCSITEMQQVVATATCLSPLPSTDVAVVASGQPPTALQGNSETLTFTVNSVGTNTANGVTFDVTIPAEVTLDGVSPSSGSCTSGAGTVNCAIGSIAAGSGVNIVLDITADSPGNTSFDATISALVDENSNNNQASIALQIDPAVDLVLTAAAAAQIAVNGSTTLVQTVQNVSDVIATNVSLTINPSAGLQIDSASWPVGSCSIAGGDVTCVAGSVAVQSSSSVTLQVTGTTEGNQSYTMAITSAEADRLSGNNNAAGQVTVGTPTQPPASDSGGSGSLGWLTLLVLLLSAHRRKVLVGN